MQGERLRSHDFGTGRTVLPLFVIIKPIVGVATVTFGPELAYLVISGPVESPQQVTGLHEVITARVACIIITAFLGTRQAGIGGQFKEFPTFWVRFRRPETRSKLFIFKRPSSWV